MIRVLWRVKKRYAIARVVYLVVSTLFQTAILCAIVAFLAWNMYVLFTVMGR